MVWMKVVFNQVLKRNGREKLRQQDSSVAEDTRNIRGVPSMRNVLYRGIVSMEEYQILKQKDQRLLKQGYEAAVLAKRRIDEREE